jgi:hypothetical protein
VLLLKDNKNPAVIETRNWVPASIMEGRIACYMLRLHARPILIWPPSHRGAGAAKLDAMSPALLHACTRQLVLVLARLVSGSSVMTVGALCGASWPLNAPKSKKKLGLSETERVIFCGCALLLF